MRLVGGKVTVHGEVKGKWERAGPAAGAAFTSRSACGFIYLDQPRDKGLSPEDKLILITDYILRFRV